MEDQIPPPHLPYEGTGRREMLPYSLLALEAERVCFGVIRAVELFLPLTSCNTSLSGLCTSPGQHGRAGPDGPGVGELMLRV